MLSLNRMALETIEPLVNDAEKHRVSVVKSGNGATIVDCGVKVPGSYGAGRLFAMGCLAGLADVAITSSPIGEYRLAAVSVAVNRPVEGCMASQYAGWAINKSGYFAMGSGPVRALVSTEDIFEHIDHKEKSDVALVCLESRKYPPDEAIDYICAKAGVTPKNLTILIAPTGSIAGSVQIAARIVETAIHKMHELGFRLESILHGCGTCPIAPVAPDDMEAIGRTNDSVLYGGWAEITVDCDNPAIEGIIDRIPSCASKDYGKTFVELYREYGDFYKIDPLLFSPAAITVSDIGSGKTYRAGALNPDIVSRSFFPG